MSFIVEIILPSHCAEELSVGKKPSEQEQEYPLGEVALKRHSWSQPPLSTAQELGEAN